MLTPAAVSEDDYTHIHTQSASDTVATGSLIECNTHPSKLPVSERFLDHSS